MSAKLVPTFADRECRVVSATDRHGRILGFLDRSRYYFFQVALQLYSRGWEDPVPDPLLLRKSCSARNRNRDLWICRQELWPLDHRGGHIHPIKGRTCVIAHFMIFASVVSYGDVSLYALNLISGMGEGSRDSLALYYKWLPKNIQSYRNQFARQRTLIVVFKKIEKRQYRKWVCYENSLQLQTLVNTVRNLRVPYKARNLMTDRTTISFSRGTGLCFVKLVSIQYCTRFEVSTVNVYI
jgi:hypothetical protein